MSISKAPETPELDASGESPIGVIVRYSLYTAVLFGQILALRWVSMTYGRRGFSESGVFECVQASVMAVITGILLTTAVRVRAFRASLLLLATCSTLAMVREFDAWLDALLTPLGWQLPALIIIVAGLAASLPYRRGLVRQIAVLVSSRSAALLWVGFIVAVFYAQIMGEKAFLQGVFGDQYSRASKRFIEESGEMCGYLIVLFGAIEASIQARCATVRSLPPRP